MARRDALLNLCLPDAPRGRRRKVLLRMHLTSDLALSRCIVWALGHAPSKADWAREVVDNLCARRQCHSCRES
eukprot:4022747-Lingulodinium_polyedra.AAC.1